MERSSTLYYIFAVIDVAVLFPVGKLPRAIASLIIELPKMLLPKSFHRRVIAAGLILVCLSASLYTAYFYKQARKQHQIAPIPKPPAPPPPINDSGDGGITQAVSEKAQERWLNRHNSSNPFKYGYREMVTREVPNLRRESFTKIESPLFAEFYTVGTIEEARTRIETQGSEPLVLDVPAFAEEPVKAGHLIFGIQTTVKRLEASIPQLTRWLPHTGAKLYVVVLEAENVAANPEKVAGLESRMRELGFDVTLLPAEEGDLFPQRYFSLVNIMYEHRTPETKWISLIDDDTFFPSMPALLAMLAKHDAEEEYYIGSLSEDWWAVSHYGLMGFGGAGLFLSLPLAKVMDANTQDCKYGLSSSAGDITIMDCVYRHTSTKLTHVPEMHQTDIQGDLSGFYESGRKHISLHHWKSGSVSINYTPMATMHLVADICGECFLQRWQFGEDMVLSNAFSIAYYPKGHLREDHEDSIDLKKMEQTFNENMDVRNSWGPTRRKLSLENEKIQYTFLDSISKDEGVRQLYVHNGVNGDPDTILEILWKAQKKG